VNEDAVNKALAKVRVIVVDVRDARHLNAVIDLFVDIGMMEYDRYGKPDGYPGEPTPGFKEDLANLMRQSVTNLEDVKGANLDEKIKKIFEGTLSLIIRPIDWKSIQEWKAAQDAVLKSL
jgi:hypothetical protein